MNGAAHFKRLIALRLYGRASRSSSSVKKNQQCFVHHLPFLANWFRRINGKFAALLGLYCKFNFRVIPLWPQFIICSDLKGITIAPEAERKQKRNAQTIKAQPSFKERESIFGRIDIGLAFLAGAFCRNDAKNHQTNKLLAKCQHNNSPFLCCSWPNRRRKKNN